MLDVILNIAVGRDYPRGQARLWRSLEKWAPDTPRMFWAAWPRASHQDVPFGFKPDAFDEALRQGYDRALWLDSQVIAIAPLAAVWDWLDHIPVLQLEDGWRLGEWTSDEALRIFGIDRDAAMQIPLSWAKVIAIDFRASHGMEFLDRWRDLRDRGAFHGATHTIDTTTWRDGAVVSGDQRCRGHRHDQSAASFLAWDMGLPMAPKTDFLSYPGDTGPVFVVKGNRE
jgi:hypothetical protein